MTLPVATSRSPDGAPVAAARVYRWLDTHRRVAAPDVLYRIYLVGLGTVPLTYAAWQGPGDGPALGVDAALTATATWGPVVIALALIAAARYASWAGIAVPERGAVTWVFAAPIARSDLLGRPLRRAVLTWMGTGALTAHLATLELVARLDTGPLGFTVAAVGGGAGVGAIAVSCCWWIQADRRRARRVVRLSPWLGAGVVAWGAVAETSTHARTALLVSGPWGWAVVPTLRAGGSPAPVAGLAAAALALVAVLLVARTLLRVDAVPTSELARRADPVSGVRAATYAGDLRFAAELRRRAHRDLVGPSRRRLPHPARPGLAIPWLGATLLLRSPRWSISSAIAGVGLTMLARAEIVAHTPQPSVVVALAGVAACTLLASQTLDPLRVEETTGFAWRHLPPTPRTSTLLHLVAPTAAAVIGVAVAVATAMATGAAPGPALGAAAGAGLALLVLMPAAALSLTAAPPEPGELAGPGSGLAWARRALGLPVGALVVAILAAGAVVTIDTGASPGAVLLGNVVPALLVAAAFGTGLVRRLTRRDD